jgi:ATP-dependent Lhr-like helicase
MIDHAFWNQLSTKRFIFEQLPEYRLSKFQQALPESYSLEIIGNYLLDIPRAVTF